jgi:hypothetical protein
MPDTKDRVLAEVKHRAREAEEGVTYQLTLVNNLRAEGRHDEERKARAQLGMLIDRMEAARRHLQTEREARGMSL